MSTTDRSSVMSETMRSNVLIRDGGLCVLCGDDPVDVVHIVARKASGIDQVIWNTLPLFLRMTYIHTLQVPFIRDIAQSLSTFRKDEPSNLICCG